ncbi:hypothetical protein ACO0QE_003947 [Hanseniaspora vineae]
MFKKAGLCMQWLDRANSNALLFTLQQVRSATKRASGSKTSMKDSAGRRLGPKKGNGAYVQPGQIIYRQRGTKFYPGENCSIGRDHTIFAKEPGWVQYYLDPFHPKRNLIGISLFREKKLPTPHFAPRIRRLGRRVIGDEKAAKKEASSLTRKQFFAKDEFVAQHEGRENKRLELLKGFESFLTNNFPSNEIFNKNSEFCGRALLLIRSNLRQGFSRDESFFNASAHFKHSAKINSHIKNNDMPDIKVIESCLAEIKKYVDFNHDYDIVEYVIFEDKLAKQQEIRAQVAELLPLNTKDKVKKAQEIFNKPELKTCFTKSEYVKFKKSIIKPVLPESVEGTVVSKTTKGATATRRFDYKTGRINTIYRSKHAFLEPLV